MNNISITGRLTAEPELRFTQQNNTAVCSFTLAVKRPHAKDSTDFLPCVVWRQGAEFLAKYAHKGDLIGANGAMTSRRFEDKNGNKRTSYDVLCDNVEILRSAGQGTVNEQEGFQEIDNEEDGELPF